MIRVLVTRVFLATAVAVLALCSARPSRADDAEDKAVAFVEELGGTVTRDEKQPGKPVVKVFLGFAKVTDAGLEELAALTSGTLVLRMRAT